MTYEELKKLKDGCTILITFASGGFISATYFRVLLREEFYIYNGFRISLDRIRLAPAPKRKIKEAKQMRSEAARRANAKYKKKLKEEGIEQGRSFMLYCHLINDADVIAVLESKSNKSGYLKELVRKDNKYN